MSAAMIQAWTGVLAGLLAAVLGLFKYFNYKSKRDRKAAVGANFSATVDALASENDTRRMAAAVLLRRFFDPKTEQGEAGTPYLAETVQVIAGLLRESQPARLQKTLADGLRYARDLRGADLQGCDLSNAYLGTRTRDAFVLDLSAADLFESTCSGTSFRGVKAVDTVFYRATCKRTVFIDAQLQGADFRAANLEGAKFEGAHLEGAQFEGAEGVPDAVRRLLTADAVAVQGAVVGR